MAVQLIMMYKEGGIPLPPALDTLIQTSTANTRRVVSAPSGDYYMGYSDLVKFNSAGVLQWSKTLSGTEDDITIINIAVDSNNDVYIIGTETVYNPETDGQDDTAILTKLSAAGAVLWAKKFAGQEIYLGASLIIDGSNILLNFVNDSGDSALIRLDSSGNILMQRDVVSGSGIHPGVLSTDSSDNIYGVTSWVTTEITKMNSSGVTQWDKKYQIGAYTEGYLPQASVIDSDGNLIVPSRVNNVSGEDRVVIRCVDSSDGSIVWEKWTSSGTEDREATGVALDANGNSYILVRYGDGVPQQFHIYSFQKDGTFRWANKLSFYDSNPGSGSFNLPYDLMVSGSNFYIISAVDEHGYTIFRGNVDGTGQGTTIDTNFTYATLSETFTTPSTTITENNVTDSAGTLAAPTTYTVTVADAGTVITDHPF